MKLEFEALVSHLNGQVTASLEKHNYRELIVRPDDTQFYAVRFNRKFYHQLKKLNTGDRVIITCQTQSARQLHLDNQKVINAIILIGTEIQSYESLQLQSKTKSTASIGYPGLELAFPWSNTHLKTSSNHIASSRKNTG